uniref:Excinuclease ABC subunit UvrC n=1 Tax=candidate division CPR3 bacterium TaxID=2268181 RepID=A0A7C4R283_UNCC3
MQKDTKSPNGARIKEIIKTIPHSPGCYKYYNNKGGLIYIGKAKDLKKRVSSYFIGKNDLKTTVLVENIADIKWEVTESEIEALILESILIKKHKPRFNIKTKDDKDFLWVKLDLGEEYPWPELVRHPNVGAENFLPLQGRVKLFGPFTDSRLLKQGLAVLRKIFLWRDCSENKFGFHKRRRKPCLEYYIKNCSAPCILSNDYQKGNNINKKSLSNSNDYHLGIKRLVLFLEGKRDSMIKDLEKEMAGLAKKKMFEEAAKVRDKLKGLENIGASLKFQITNDKFQTKFKSQIPNGKNNKQILENIIKTLNSELGYGLKFKKDFRIEFYDISNTSGSEAVGSMVVSVGGELAKGQYRKFRIRTVKGANDFGMMREVLFRRLKKITNYKLQITNKSQNSNDKFQNKNPDLIVLDGGKPQLREIAKLFTELKIDIPLLGLAKEEEEIYGINNKLQITNDKQIPNSKFQILNIKKDSAEGFFIQRLRDEAHRFAITYHKNLRTKKIFRSRLDDIEGIGPKTKKKLLLHFGSIQGIIDSNLKDLENTVGKKLALKIKNNL